MMRPENSARAPVRAPFLAASLLSLALITLPAAALAQASTRIDTVDKWDMTLESVRAMGESLHSATDKGPKDIRGRTADDDWQQWVLTKDAQARLDELREKVRAQATLSDFSGVQQTMREAVPLVEAQAYRSRLLSTYWLVEGALAHHRKLIETLLASAPKDQAKTAAAGMKATEQRVADMLAPAMAVDPAGAGTEELLKLRRARIAATDELNRQRTELVTQLAGRIKTPPRSRTRRAPCPEAVTKTSGSEKPKLAPSEVSLDEVYPVQAQRDDVEGRVVVRVSISPTGCMEKAEIATSAGADELDEAAMLWAEKGSFVPPEKAGKAVAGSFQFAVQFKLPD
ncbi:MAG: energy transducer TonB [Gammaproteobacteria bacterium]